MFLLVPAHPGCPGQIPQSRKMVLCVCVLFTGHNFVFVWSGPDTLEVADSYITWNRKQAVKLRTSDIGPQAQTPISIVTAFQQTVARFPNHTALGKYCLL